MSNIQEFRAFGPPGCGKTTWAAARAREFSGKWGGAALAVTSFTKAAATRIAGEDLGVPPGQVGTLHALCYRALGRPPLAESALADFNKACAQYQLTGRGPAAETLIDTPPGEGGADKLLARYALFRATLGRQGGPAGPEDPFFDFMTEWQGWKERNGLLDFSDLLDEGLKLEAPFGGLRAMVVDEAQDLTPQQLRLVRHWGESLRWVCLVGDDDQCLYSWTGANPADFLLPDVPPERKHVLGQSYRVPRAVHALAERLTGQIVFRQAKRYAPRPEEGAVRKCGATCQRPHKLLPLVEQSLAAGRSVMVLASCGHMLEATLALFAKEGVPFHNPYRPAAGAWNRLRLGGGKAVTAADRVLAFLAGDPRQEAPRWWSYRDWWRWAEHTDSAALWRRGFKDWLRQGKDDDAPLATADLLAWATPEAREELYALNFGTPQSCAASLGWLLGKLLGKKRGAYELPAAVAARRGPQGLRETPRVVVGSVHSTKGAEADDVYLFPDLSPAAHRAYLSAGSLRDSVLRMAYVGVTRARQSLTVCDPAGYARVDLGV